MYRICRTTSWAIVEQSTSLTLWWKWIIFNVWICRVCNRAVLLVVLPLHLTLKWKLHLQKLVKLWNIGNINLLTTITLAFILVVFKFMEYLYFSITFIENLYFHPACFQDLYRMAILFSDNGFTEKDAVLLKQLLEVYSAQATSLYKK